MIKEGEQLLIVSNFYEKKLAELMTKDEFEKTAKHAFRLLMANDLLQCASEGWVNLNKKILKMDDSEYESLCDELMHLIPETIKAREAYDEWDPDEDDDLLDFDEEIEDDDDFDI